MNERIVLLVTDFVDEVDMGKEFSRSADVYRMLNTDDLVLLVFEAWWLLF